MDTENRKARGASETKDAPAKGPAANDAPAKDGPAEDPAASDAAASDEAANDAPAKDADDRQAFQCAIVAAMAEFGSSRPRPRSLPRISATPSSADREAHRRAFAALLQVPLEEVTDARLDKHTAALRRSAEADADALVAYLDDWVKHFQAIGCPCSQGIDRREGIQFRARKLRAAGPALSAASGMRVRPWDVSSSSRVAP